MLDKIYKDAAIQANNDGISADNQDALVDWIRANCSYRPDTEFFLVLGIGCELADLQGFYLVTVS